MNSLAALTNEELIHSLKSLVGDERESLVAIVKHLAEFENRRLATEVGFPSLFEYCVRELRYAQGEAFRRIRAARAADKFKILYRLLERGTLSLTSVALLEPHLKWNNYRKLIRASIGKSTREMEALVAALSPVPTEPIDRIRFLTVEASVPPAEAADFFTQTPMSEPQGIAPPTTVPQEAPAAPGAPQTSAVRRVHFSFTGDEDLLHGYERAKELSRHKWAGRMEDVFGGAIKALLEKIDPDQRQRRKERARRLAAGRRSRGIAATVKDVVWRRDGGRCSYQSEESRACGARAGLEFDHVRPWALGGSSDPVNVRLLCRAHNQLEARRVFGDAKIDAAIGASRGTSGRTEGGR